MIAKTASAANSHTNPCTTHREHLTALSGTFSDTILRFVTAWADFRLSQRSMTALDYGRQIG